MPGQSRGSPRRPEPPCPGLAPCEGQERCVWAEPGPGFDPALARLGAGSTGSKGNKKGSSNLNLTAGPRPESGTPLPSRLRHSWLPSQAGPGPVLVPPRDTSDSQKDRSILGQTGWDMAQFRWGIAWLCACGVCDSLPELLRWAVHVIPEDFETQLPQLPLIPCLFPGKHHHASAAWCILDCTVVLEPGEDRQQHPAPHAIPCTLPQCHLCVPPGRSRACPWTSWRLLSSWVSVGRGGSLHTHSTGSCGASGISV